MATKDILTEALQSVMPDAAPEEAELLKSIKDEELKKSIFICLIYRMDPGRLKELMAKNASYEEVIRERNAFLVSLASDQDPVIQEAEKALEKAEKLEKEQESIKEYLINELSQALEMAKTYGERERNALREQIAILMDQVESEQQQNVELKEKTEEMNRQLQENLSRIAEYEVQTRELQQKSSQAAVSMPAANNRTEEQMRQIQELYDAFRRPRRPRRSEAAVLQELEEFCTKLANNKELNYEQKDCLLSCLEQGYPLSLISKVMMATLTPEEMVRFIKVYEKRMGGRKR